MAQYNRLSYHGNPEPTIPRPANRPMPRVVTVRDGVPVIYSEDSLPCCGIRVVHPSNPNAPSKNHSIVMFYAPPHAKMELHSHETEETYCVISGSGDLLTTAGTVPVSAGSFIYLESWAEHGIENTGRDMLVVLLATSPPNP